MSEIDRLARDLGETGRSVGPELVEAFKKPSELIRNAWRDKLRGSGSLPGLARAVDYEIGSANFSTAVQSEIGINKGRFQGPLGNFSEFGKPGQPGRGYGSASLEENRETVERAVDHAVDEALKAHGL